MFLRGLIGIGVLLCGALPCGAQKPARKEKAMASQATSGVKAANLIPYGIKIDDLALVTNDVRETFATPKAPGTPLKSSRMVWLSETGTRDSVEADVAVFTSDKDS